MSRRRGTLLQTVLSAILVFISTSIDYLFILLFIFSNSHFKSAISQVYIGQYLGTGVLVGFSILAAYVLNFIPQSSIVGLLGFIPIILGVRFVFSTEEELEEKEIDEKLRRGNTKQLIWAVTLLTIASGGDNLGIYIPYFTTLTWPELFLVLTIFIILIWVLCTLSLYLSKIPLIEKTIDKYERIIVPIVFIGLGIFILVENGTVQMLWSFIP